MSTTEHTTPTLEELMAELDAQTPDTVEAKGTTVVDPTHTIPESVDPLLVTILSWIRTHDSLGEYAFCKWLRETISQMGATPVIREKASGAITVLIGGEKKTSTIFSCHVDTQDGRAEHSDKLRKGLLYDPNFGHITLDPKSAGGCLGADDGVGVWIMLRMIEARVPGLYVFHRGEECGGISAKGMAKEYADELRCYEAAVAFDRPNNSEVITHQRGGTECASTKFAAELSKRLNEHGMDFKPSQAGVYTDTYEYRLLVAECVNIGVGYWGQHGRGETLDYAHASALLNACLRVDWESLPIERDCDKAATEERERQERYSRHYNTHPWDRRSASWDYPPFGRTALGQTTDMFSGADAKFGKKKTKPTKGKAAKFRRSAEPELTIDQELADLDYTDLDVLCNEDPESALRIIVALMVELNKTRAERDTYMRLVYPNAV